MKMKKAILAAALLAAANVAPALVTGMPAPAMTAYAAMVDDVTDEVIRADGYCPIQPNVPKGLAMSSARRGAKLDALRNLGEEIKGLTVNSETTMENFVVTSDVVKTKFDGLIQGARLVSSEVTADGELHVVYEVRKYGVGSVADVAINALTNGAAPVPVAAPSADYAPITAVVGDTAQAAANYTGLIIDAKGSGLERTFCPGIFDTNDRPIYGVANVDPDYAVRKGVAGYAEGEAAWAQAEAGQSRAGATPLVIRAVCLRERSTHKCDIVVTPEDGDKILAANQQSHFLDNYAVTLEM